MILNSILGRNLIYYYLVEKKHNIISIEKTTFVEYDYLVAPTINYNFIKDHTYFNLSEIPIYISKQSFLI